MSVVFVRPRTGWLVSLPAFSANKISRLIGSAILSFLVYYEMDMRRAPLIFAIMLLPGACQLAIFKAKGFAADVLIVPFLGLLVRARYPLTGADESSALAGPQLAVLQAFLLGLLYLFTQSATFFFLGAWAAYVATVSLLPVLPLPGGIILALLTRRAAIFGYIFLGALFLGFLWASMLGGLVLPALLACGWHGDREPPAPLVSGKARHKQIVRYLVTVGVAFGIFIPYAIVALKSL